MSVCVYMRMGVHVGVHVHVLATYKLQTMHELFHCVSHVCTFWKIAFFMTL